VGLLPIRRLLEHARVVLRGHLVHRIEALEAGHSAAGRSDYARPVTRADEDVLRPRRAVDKVPGLQAALLTLDHEHTLAGDVR
jgi:hypothetical protein